MLVLAAFGYLYHRNRKKHQKEIEKLAFYDNLTGLYRYEKFLLDGQLILEKKEQPVAVLYLDIMGFKLLNDMEGLWLWGSCAAVCCGYFTLCGKAAGYLLPYLRR